jgi:hypothetical protein
VSKVFEKQEGGIKPPPHRVKRYVTLAVTKINNNKREKEKDTGMNI